MIDAEYSRKIQNIMNGSALVDWKYYESGMLILYILIDSTPEDSQWTLIIDSAWRILSNNIVIAGSLDTKERLTDVLTQFCETTILRASLGNLVGDIKIEVSDNPERSSGPFVLETFGRAMDTDHWQLRSPLGYRIGMCEGFALREWHEIREHNSDEKS